MVRPEDVRFLPSSSLPRVGELFFDVADTLSAEEEPLSRDLAISSIEKNLLADGLIEVRYHVGDGELSPLRVLRAARDFRDYHGDSRYASRLNVITMSRLGGYAAYGIYTAKPDLSDESMYGVRSSFLTVHNKLDTTFSDVARRDRQKDRAALALVNKLGRTLRGF